ncbi:MAG: hypothetical protein R3A44_30825 [Caldilineaceae bacterium]
MSHSREQQQLNELQNNNIISAMLDALPGASPPSESAEDFNQQKDALSTKLTASMALETNKRGTDEH